MLTIQPTKVYLYTNLNIARFVEDKVREQVPLTQCQIGLRPTNAIAQHFRSWLKRFQDGSIVDRKHEYKLDLPSPRSTHK
jgi:hypothetical protein